MESAQPISAGPITETVKGFSARIGISRDFLYRLLKAGEIESVLVGRRRLVITASYHAYLDRLRAAQKNGTAPVSSPNSGAPLRRRAAAAAGQEGRDRQGAEAAAG